MIQLRLEASITPVSIQIFCSRKVAQYNLAYDYDLYTRVKSL
jgi:hypothetical protein